MNFMTAIVILDLLVWPVPLAQVLPGPQLILGENLRGIGMWLWCCWKDLDEQDLMKIQINSLNLAHWDLSNNTKATFQFLLRFSPTILFYFIFQWRNHSIFKNFCTASPNPMKPSRCTLPHRELSKETKNMIWSIPVQWISWVQNKTNYLPS